MELLKLISEEDEIKIGFDCIKKGIIEFSKFGPTTVHLFIPLLLISTGFERILKILYCLNFKQVKNRYPTTSELRNDINHSLKKLKEDLILTLESNELYHTAQARIDDIDFLKNNSDFLEFITILDDFSKKGRYFNLDMITSGIDYFSKPEGLISKLLNRMMLRYPDVIEEQMKPPYNTQLIYDYFNPYIIEIVQRFARLLCFAFTQGAYGNKARQISATFVNDFLSLRDEQLSTINFTIQ